MTENNFTELRRRILADPELTRWLGSLMGTGELVPEVLRLAERLGLPVDEAEVRRSLDPRGGATETGRDGRG